jgi:YD repeat-containing protein
VKTIGKILCIAGALAVPNAHAEILPTAVPGHFDWVGNYVTGEALYAECVSLVTSIHANVATWCGSKAVTVAPDSYTSIIGGWIVQSGNNPSYYLSAYACKDSEKIRYFNDSYKCMGITKVTTATPSNPKNNGPSCPDQPSCGNPITIGPGNKVQQEVDYQDQSAGLPLSLTRTYNYGQNSIVGVAGSFGSYWTHQIDRKVQLLTTQVSVNCYTRNDSNVMFCENAPVSNTPQSLSATRPDGKVYVFLRSGNTWVADADVNERLSAQYGVDGVTPEEWTLTTVQGDIEKYDVNGRLTSITARTGVSQRFTYSEGSTNDTSVARLPADAPICPNVQAGVAIKAGLLVCVTDNWNRQIQFEYDSQGRVVKAHDPANQVYMYSYDGATGGCVQDGGVNRACTAGNLTQVTFPDGKTKTYHYNERARINDGTSCGVSNNISPTYGHLVNALTGITDENGVRYASWNYTCHGSVVGSEHAGGVEKVSVFYGTRAVDGSQTNTVTSYLGTVANPITMVRNYHFKLIQGVAKNDSLDQPCVGCEGMMARTYDTNGNVKTSKDWNGNLSNYSYDLARNLETSRTEAVGSSVARTITTEWHPTLRLRTRLAEPLRITTFSYDANGNVTSKSIQPTFDSNGAQGFNAQPNGVARSWTYVYNELGQVTSMTGPLNAKTNYTYDSEGRLAAVKIAEGNITSLDNYDANGRVGRITDPNGLVTDLTYTPRGWLAASSTGGEMTSYEHDGVGQVTKVTLPDGAWVSYSYDPAHRLIGISDRNGNSITYTLDLVGNRISEQVKGAGGVLARQVTRAYNTLNRLTQVTGAQQ